MQSWYRLETFTQAEQDAAREVLTMNGGPIEAAVYTYNFSEYFFNPSMALFLWEFLESRGATECRAPDRKGLVLLVGDQRTA